MTSTKVIPPVLMADGRTADGRYAIDVPEYAAVRGISTATAWRRARSGAIAVIQPTGKNGRVHIPVRAVLAELGLSEAIDTRPMEASRGSGMALGGAQ